MPMGETVTASETIEQAVQHFKAAQTMGKIAARMESQAAELRRAIDDLNLENIKAPEGQAFNIAVNNHEGRLVVEPFIHRQAVWGVTYIPGDDEYENLVERSGWGDDANINVDTLGYEDAQTWGYDSLHRVRVLIDDTVAVRLVEVA